jgi:2-methylcitrate dehydratase
MDSYLAPGETCHPSDNLAPVLAAAEYAQADGKALLTALAVAYQVQARLSDAAPLRDRGFDHTTQGAFSVAAGAAKALGLDIGRTAHAIAMAGVDAVGLRATRTGALSHWKGLAFAHTAFGAVQATFLAMRGVTGPLEVFEGVKGFQQSVSGPFQIDWEREDLERVRRTVVKKHNSEVHSQTAVDAALELRSRHGFDGGDVAQVELEIFDVAHLIIGGGEEGDKHVVGTKEQADHSLPYVLAVALLDGQLMPAQYAPDRIVAPDVQDLLRRVTIRPDHALSARFPEEMPCRVAITLKDGRRFELEARDYEGFHTRPATWEGVRAKFERLAEPFASAEVRAAIVEAVMGLEALKVADLTKPLGEISPVKA